MGLTSTQEIKRNTPMQCWWSTALSFKWTLNKYPACLDVQAPVSFLTKRVAQLPQGQSCSSTSVTKTPWWLLLHAPGSLLLCKLVALVSVWEQLTLLHKWCICFVEAQKLWNVLSHCIVSCLSDFGAEMCCFPILTEQSDKPLFHKSSFQRVVSHS